MPLWVIYIPNFGKVSVKKIQFWGAYTLIVATDGDEIWHGGVDQEWTSVHSSVPNFTPTGATCRPCGVKNLKTGR